MDKRRSVAKVDALTAPRNTRLEANLTATDETRRLLEAHLAEALVPVEDREAEAAE